MTDHRTDQEHVYRDGSFYIHHVSRQKYYTMNHQHYHRGYELYYLFSGERYYFIRDDVYHIQSGTLVLINKYDLHKTKHAGAPEHTRMVINFRENDVVSMHPEAGDVLERLFGNGPVILRFNQQERSLIEHILNKMIADLAYPKTGRNVLLKALVLEMLVFACRYTEQYASTPQRSPIHPKIAEVVRYINRYYYLPFDLDSLAVQFQMSKYHLSRTFKESIGFRLFEYIHSLRMKEAERLLRETKLSVTEISEQVGYSNQAHFSRVFKAHHTLSPLQFRKANRL